jgi:glycerate dehydrogenase
MKIVVLDGHTLNPGDMSWDPISRLGALTVHEHTPEEQILARAGGAEIVLTNKTPLTADTLAALDELRYVGVLATGVNVVDLEAARKRNLPVTNIPQYSTASVAQMTIAHLLHLCHHVAEHAASVRRGTWAECRDFCYWESPQIELEGKTIGIIGYGEIGQRTAALARALGMKVLGYSPSRWNAVERGEAPEVTKSGDRITDCETLLRESDVVSLHCPLTQENRHLIDARAIEQMKPTAFLLNTGRGALIDEAALAEALNNGRLAGAGLDVLSTEPPGKDNPLSTAENCFITPHIAWATRAARERLLRIAADNIAAFLSGKPKNVVS